MESYYCENFKFLGENSLAIAFFINGHFGRLAINLEQDISPIIAGLTKKYGNASTTVTSEDLERVKQHGGRVSISFDSDTVFLQVLRDKSTMEDTAQLIYTSSEFESLHNKLQENEIESDI
jgi:hypothetical protein